MPVCNVVPAVLDMTKHSSGSSCFEGEGVLHDVLMCAMPRTVEGVGVDASGGRSCPQNVTTQFSREAHVSQASPSGVPLSHKNPGILTQTEVTLTTALTRCDVKAVKLLEDYLMLPFTLMYAEPARSPRLPSRCGQGPNQVCTADVSVLYQQ